MFNMRYGAAVRVLVYTNSAIAIVIDVLLDNNLGYILLY